MKIRRIVVGILFVLAGAFVARADDDVAPRAALAPAVARLEAFVRGEMESKGLPAVSIAVVEGKEITWARGFGLARPAEHVTATAGTVYRVGSVSKLFTDLAVMRLVEEGKLDLDAPVTRYLPDFTPTNPSTTPVTLRQLMAHRSGLARETPVGHYFDATPPSLAETVRSLNRTTLVYPAGTHTKYSNAGVAVVGRVVEVVRAEPFADAVAHSVIEPLGLRSTGFVRTPAMSASLARGLMWTYDGRTFDAPTFPLGTAPAGNLEASVADLGRFLAALLDGGRGPNGRVVRPETLRAMWAPQFADAGAPRSYGLGFALSELDGHRRVGHGGAIYGFATEVAALPDEQLGVAVVVTRDCANTVATRIADAALRCLLAVKHGKPLPGIESTRPLSPGVSKELAGRYGDGDEAVDFRARDGRLYLTAARGGFRVELREGAGGVLIADDVLGFGTRVRPDGGKIVLDGTLLPRHEVPRPDPPPSRSDGLIGEYGWDHDTLYILERNGRLHALIEWFFIDPLDEVDADHYTFPDRGLYPGESLQFTRDASGRATQVVAGGVVFPRRKIDGDDGTTFRIKPVRPVAELRPEALAARPPAEPGPFLQPELTELTALDPGIRLEIRYAGTNNFLGTPLYSSARAFLQRPAAEALVRAHRALAAQGYGLLVHDAYRPWYVTRMFWDATPDSGHAFVADPSKGSKHNRGCAVDLTLYDLSTGRPVEMVGGYDEFSNRSSPDYPGGTSRQRWHRELLRRVMEDQGFTVNEVEWWHFDFRDWPHYPILNAPFEDLRSPTASSVPTAAPPTVREGDQGTVVERLQRSLNARLDPSPTLDVDGDFGTATRAALQRFQRAHGLEATGVADARTWEALGAPPPSEPEPPAPEVVNGTPPAKAPPDPLDGLPFVSCKAWIVVDGRTGQLIAGHDESVPREMASTTKMMTALIVARLARANSSVLDEVVTFSERADRTGGSTSGLKAGEHLPVRELLYGLLLPSGNDAAVAFAEHFGGRFGTAATGDAQARFVAEMNRVAAELGLRETHYANPHGLPAPDHHSSARDLAQLARAALAEPVFARVVATARHGAAPTDRDGRRRNVVWTNTNHLLRTEGYDGVKTGTTTAAGSCLVASGRRGGDHLIVVVLGGPTADARDADARNLFRWGWNRSTRATGGSKR